MQTDATLLELLVRLHVALYMFSSQFKSQVRPQPVDTKYLSFCGESDNGVKAFEKVVMRCNPKRRFMISYFLFDHTSSNTN